MLKFLYFPLWTVAKFGYYLLSMIGSVMTTSQNWKEKEPWCTHLKWHFCQVMFCHEFQKKAIKNTHLARFQLYKSFPHPPHPCHHFLCLAWAQFDILLSLHPVLDFGRNFKLKDFCVHAWLVFLVACFVIAKLKLLWHLSSFLFFNIESHQR